MRFLHMILVSALFSQTACAQDKRDEVPSAEVDSPSEEEIFEAAGFAFSEGSWRKCGDPGTVSYEPGMIRDSGDFNGDGSPDAVVIETGTYCFGMTGSRYTLVSRSPDGNWRIMDERIGIPRFLESRGEQGWPDIEVGGPGFCFPVLRWDGKSYLVDRNEYEGRAC